MTLTTDDASRGCRCNWISDWCLTDHLAESESQLRLWRSLFWRIGLLKLFLYEDSAVVKAIKNENPVVHFFVHVTQIPDHFVIYWDEAWRARAWRRRVSTGRATTFHLSRSGVLIANCSSISYPKLCRSEGHLLYIEGILYSQVVVYWHVGILSNCGIGFV